MAKEENAEKRKRNVKAASEMCVIIFLNLELEIAHMWIRQITIYANFAGKGNSTHVPIIVQKTDSYIIDDLLGMLYVFFVLFCVLWCWMKQGDGAQKSIWQWNQTQIL